MDYVVREPVPADADDIGAVHVRAWQAAYVGLMPDDYLQSSTVEERAVMWRQGLANPPQVRSARRVAESTDDGRVVGFCVVGPEAGDESAEGGELYAINVDPDQWGRGAGGLLMEAGLAALAEAGFQSAILWVHPGNDRARRFYERGGWTTDGTERTEEVLGVTVAELRYQRPLP